MYVSYLVILLQISFLVQFFPGDIDHTLRSEAWNGADFSETKITKTMN